MAARILSNRIRRDMVDGGNYQIQGTTTELGVAGAYRVQAFERLTGRRFRQVWSNPDGSFVIPYIAYKDRGYFLICFDHNGDPLLNAAIADLVTPELMP